MEAKMHEIIVDPSMSYAERAAICKNIALESLQPASQPQAISEEDIEKMALREYSIMAEETIDDRGLDYPAYKRQQKRNREAFIKGAKAMLEIFHKGSEEEDSVYEEVVRSIYGEDVLTTEQMVAELKGRFTIHKKKQDNNH